MRFLLNYLIFSVSLLNFVALLTLCLRKNLEELTLRYNCFCDLKNGQYLTKKALIRFLEVFDSSNQIKKKEV